VEHAKTAGPGAVAGAARRRPGPWPLRWGKVALGALLLALLGWHVDWPATLAALRRSDPPLVAAAGAVLLLALLVSTLKWERLARVACGRPLDRWLLLRAYWVGTFANNFLPSSVGGDVARLMAVAPAAPLAPVAASVLVERLTGVAVLALLSALCLLARPPAPAELAAALWLLVAAVAGGVALVWAGGPRLAGLGPRLAGLGPRLVARLAAKLGRIAADVAGYRAARAELLVAVGWSLAFYGCLALFQFLVLRAVGSAIGFGEAALVAPLVPLVSLLPVTANGLGLTEGAFVVLYAQMGVPAEQALAAALLRRLVMVAVSLPGGLLWPRGGRRPEPDGPARERAGG
jgi:glycosyltransferase 2 family protein